MENRPAAYGKDSTSMLLMEVQEDTLPIQNQDYCKHNKQRWLQKVAQKYFQESKHQEWTEAHNKCQRQQLAFWNIFSK